MTRPSYELDSPRKFAEFRFLAELDARRLTHIDRSWWDTSTSLSTQLERLGTILVDSQNGTDRVVLLEVEHCVALVERFSVGRVTLSIAACDRDSIASLRQAIRRALPPTRSEEDQIPVEFWYHDHRLGARSITRTLSCPGWLEIAQNYPTRTRALLAPLMDAFEPTRTGLLLFHGEPGTGKTSALRALARAWSSWCRIEMVSDPEQFFGEAGYMLSVVTSKPRATTWQLIILEDTGELLAADARERQGQRLARFLNTVDGMIGQGLKLLVALSTNEPPGMFHPAVVRPGRCLATVEFEAFTPRGAAAWLRAWGLDADVRSPKTLAELYARAAGEAAPYEAARAPIGFR